MLFPHFWAGPEPWAGTGPFFLLSFTPPPQQLPPTTSPSGNSTEPVAGWGKGQANSELQAQLLILWRREGKFLQKWGKKNKQLSSCQLFSKAHPLSWKTKMWVTWLGGLCQQGRKSSTMSSRLAKPERNAGLPGPGPLCTQLSWSQPPGVTEALQAHSTFTHSAPSGLRQVSKGEGAEYRGNKRGPRLTYKYGWAESLIKIH